MNAYVFLALQLFARDLLLFSHNDRNIRYKQLLVYVMPIATRPMSYPLFMKGVTCAFFN